MFVCLFCGLTELLPSNPHLARSELKDTLHDYPKVSCEERAEQIRNVFKKHNSQPPHGKTAILQVVTMYFNTTVQSTLPILCDFTPSGAQQPAAGSTSEQAYAWSTFTTDCTQHDRYHLKRHRQDAQKTASLEQTLQQQNAALAHLQQQAKATGGGGTGGPGRGGGGGLGRGSGPGRGAGAPGGPPRSSSSEGGDTGPSGLGPRVTERPDYAQLHTRGTTGRDSTDPRGQGRGRGRGRDAAGGAPRGPLSDGVQELTVSNNAAAADADERLSLGAFRLGGSTEPTANAASTVPAADQLLAAASTLVLLQQKHDIATKDPKQSVLLAAADIPSSPSVAAAPSSSPAGCSSNSPSSNSTSSSSTAALSAAAHSSQQQPATVEVAATATRGRQQQEQAAPASASAQQPPSHIKPRSAEKAVGEPPFTAPPPQPHPFGNKIMKAPVPMTLGDLFALVSGDLAETRTAIHALAQSLAKETGISLPKATSAACGDFRHVQQHMQVAVTGSAVASSSSR